MTALLKPALSALVKPAAAAVATWLVTRIPGLDPDATEAMMSSVLVAVATLAVEQVAKRKKQPEDPAK